MTVISGQEAFELGAQAHAEGRERTDIPIDIEVRAWLDGWDAADSKGEAAPEPAPVTGYQAAVTGPTLDPRMTHKAMTQEEEQKAAAENPTPEHPTAVEEC